MDVAIPAHRQQTSDRRSPRPDVGPNIIFGPGGQASIVSQNISAQPEIVSHNEAPQNIQSKLTSSGILTTASSQPLPESTKMGAASGVIGAAPTMETSLITVVSVAPSTPTRGSVMGSIEVTSVSASIVTSAATSIFISTLVTVDSSSWAPSTAETSATMTAVFGSMTSDSSQTPSPVTSSAASNASHNPPFYVGIALGTIVIIACLAALIAWGVRLRLHARRRRSAEAPHVPWANPANDDSGLEAGHETAFIGSRNLTINTEGADISSQDRVSHGHTWEPRGDRDVGEPKRTDSFLDSPISPFRRSTQAYDPFNDSPQYPSLADSAAYPLPTYNGPYLMGQSVPYQYGASGFDARGSVDDHGSASTLGPLQVANMLPGDSSAASSRAPTALGMNVTPSGYGTPREAATGSRPRFMGLDGEGLHVPWGPLATSRSRGLSFGSRRGGSGGGNWEHLPPMPMPGECNNELEAAERDGWTSSIKSNLANAFNAVASTLPLGPTMDGTQEDRLTPSPSRKGDDRRSLHQEEWRQFNGNDGRPLARVGTSTSSSWTLEETANGSGTVHFHGHGLDRYSDENYTFSPQPGGSSLTLQDDSQSDTGTDVYRITTRESQTPLIHTRMPQSALLRPDIYSRISQYRGMKAGAGTGSVSRASSIYSMASGTSTVYEYPRGRTPHPPPPRIPALSRQSTITISSLNPHTKRDRTTNERPVPVTRLSSSGCSFASYYRSDGTASGMDDSADTEDVHQAITDRRKKVRRVI